VFSRSNYGIQLVEKQKARFTYGLTSKQFSLAVKSVLGKKGVNQKEMLLSQLERRLDNVVYRAGLAPTRQAARQLVSHGHIMVDGKKVTIPSYKVFVNEIISIRPGSQKNKTFSTLDESLKTRTTPSWLTLDIEKRTVRVQGEPKLAQTELLFDLAPVLEFYSR